MSDIARKWVVCTLLCISSSANAQDPEIMKEALQDCDKNQLFMNFCARHAFDVADAELNKIYQTVMAAMLTPKAKERLRQAQRAWVDFRDKDCLVRLGPSENGGSMYQQLWWSCVERRTKDRVAELENLEKLVKCEERPCPPAE